MSSIERTRELIRRTKEAALQQKKEDQKLNRLMNKILKETIPSERFEIEDTEEWYFEHDEFNCPNCKEGSLSLYLGKQDGEDAQKYECNECDYEEIILLKNMRID